MVGAKIFRHDYDADIASNRRPDKLDKISDDDVVCTLRGSWKGEIFYTKKGEGEKLLVDMGSIEQWEKHVRSEEEQDAYESHRIWSKVTHLIATQSFSQATKAKRDLEDEQRRREKERAEAKIEFESVWFEFHDEATADHPVGAGLGGKPFLKTGSDVEAKLKLLGL
jgi:hypothetical protein